MKIKVTKRFAAFIENLKKTHELPIEEAKVVNLTPRAYVLNLGTEAMLDAEDYGDYDIADDTYRAIRVVYPWDYYAPARFLSTKELIKESRRRNVKDSDQLEEMLVDMLNI